jgi:epoxyqueuosine reductase
MSQNEFSARFKGSAMKRAKRRGLARNAAVVLGNVGMDEDVPLLESALAHDEPLVREHAAWALGSIGTAEAIATLRARLPFEEEESVRLELVAALARRVP